MASESQNRPDPAAPLQRLVGRGRLNSLQARSLWLYTTAKNVDYSVNNILKWLGLQLPHAPDHQAPVGGEQLAGAGVTGDVERASRKIIIDEGECAWITIGRAGDLAQNPIVPADIGQDDRRAQLGLG